MNYPLLMQRDTGICKTQSDLGLAEIHKVKWEWATKPVYNFFNAYLRYALKFSFMRLSVSRKNLQKNAGIPENDSDRNERHLFCSFP